MFPGLFARSNCPLFFSLSLRTSVVFKVGAYTGIISAGKFQVLKGAIFIAEKITLKEDKHLGRMSEEFCMIQNQVPRDPDEDVGAFSDRGDSRSVVWDGEGYAVGLLFTGQPVMNAEQQRLTHVTPIHDIFDDIRSFTDRQITDILVAE